MPDPKTLKVGDLVRFVELPAEWAAAGCAVSADSVELMKRLIGRPWPARVCRVDQEGYPWIRAVTIDGGRRFYHDWMIRESTGWRQVGNNT